MRDRCKGNPLCSFIASTLQYFIHLSQDVHLLFLPIHDRIHRCDNWLCEIPMLKENSVGDLFCSGFSAENNVAPIMFDE